MHCFVEVTVMMMLLLSNIVTPRPFLLDFSTGVENVKGTEGETVTVIFNSSELGPVRKVKILASENGPIVSQNCSVEEKMLGCEEINASHRIFVYIDHKIVSLVFRNFSASDTGVYSFLVVGSEVKNKSFSLTNERRSGTDNSSNKKAHLGWLLLLLVPLSAVFYFCCYRKLQKRHSSVPTSGFHLNNNCLDNEADENL